MTEHHTSIQHILDDADEQCNIRGGSAHAAEVLGIAPPNTPGAVLAYILYDAACHEHMARTAVAALDRVTMSETAGLLYRFAGQLFVRGVLPGDPGWLPLRLAVLSGQNPCGDALKKEEQRGSPGTVPLTPDKEDGTEAARARAQSGDLHSRAPGRELAAVLAEISAELGAEAGADAADPGTVLALCLEKANQLEHAYRGADRRADNKEADAVDTQYMEDELVYPLKLSARLRRLALEVLVEHRVWPTQVPS